MYNNFVCSSFRPLLNLAMNFVVVLLLGLFYVWMYLNAPDSVAQDRNSYYQWYLDVSQGHLDRFDWDFGFSYLISLLPGDLNQKQFESIFAIAAYIFTCVPVFLACIRFGKLNAVPVIILCLLTNRLFLDAIMNSTRSTTATLLLILTLFVKSRMLIFALVAVAYCMHQLMVILLFFVWIFTLLYRRLELNNTVAISICAILLLFKYFILTNLNSWFEGISFVSAYINAEAVSRGLQTTGTLSFSFLLQIVGYVLIPIILCFKSYNLLSVVNISNVVPNYKLVEKILNASVAFFLVVVALYPDFNIIRRLFVVPIYSALMILPSRFLLPYAFLSTIIFFSYFINWINF